MPLHVIPADNAARQTTACAALKAQGLDAILMFRPKAALSWSSQTASNGCPATVST